jgi:hypothetical protein
VIYLDSSVALAHLLAEDRRPPPALWNQVLATSRLLEYEVWNRLNARGLTASHGEQARLMFARCLFLELSRPVLARALEPFPTPVHTLDSLHLASADFLRTQGQRVEIASYDQRFLEAARALGFAVSSV